MTDLLLEAVGARLLERDRDTRLPCHDSPSDFARDYITWPDDRGLAPYQVEIMDALVEHRRVSARGPHGLGKSCVAALTVLWFACTREAAGVNWKILTTASAWRQLEKFLWPEISRWSRQLRYDKLGRSPFDSRTELMNTMLRLPHGQAFAGASNDPALLEGAHADSMLVIFDEAKTIPAPTWEALEGALSGVGEAYALAVSTPGTPDGVFYDIHSRKQGYEDWHVRHVSLEEAIEAGRISPEWATARARQWGKDSAVYANRVAGEFATSDEDGAIPLSWVEDACDRWEVWKASGDDPGPVTVVGVDVARSGADSTVLALRAGDIITELRRYSLADTMTTVGHVVGVLESNPGAKAVVDVIGVGGGVVDRLRELGHKNTVGFNASSGTSRKDRSKELGFLNLRAAAWWHLRERLDPTFEPTICLPPDDLLIGDLTAPRYTLTSAGKLQLESKDDMRKRLGRSTDAGDAVVMALFDEPGGGTGAGWLAYWRQQIADQAEHIPTPAEARRASSPYADMSQLEGLDAPAVTPGTRCYALRWSARDGACWSCGSNDLDSHPQRQQAT